jgi:predicted  nucleic acid-binding Zn-ribbon protein
VLPELEALVRLQDVDGRIDRLSGELGKIPALIEAEKTHLREFEENVAEAEAALEAMQKRQRETEGEIQMTDEKLRESRGKQSMVKTNEEYRALTREIETFQRKVGELEEGVLECMEATGPLQEKVGESKKEVAAAQETINVALNKHEDARARIEHELEKARREREGAWSEVGPDWQGRYEQLRKGLNGRAVVPMIDRTCQGCRMSETIQRFFEIRDSKDGISSCSSCGRIIYYKEAEAVSAVSPADESD